MEKGGASRSPGVRSTAAEAGPETGAFQTCVRRPSFQASQCLKRSFSATRAFVLDFSRSLNFFSLHAASTQSGKTSAVKTNHFPSGDHRKPLMSTVKEEAFAGSPRARERSRRPARLSPARRTRRGGSTPHPRPRGGRRAGEERAVHGVGNASREPPVSF